jgi:hypothetical protein
MSAGVVGRRRKTRKKQSRPNTPKTISHFNRITMFKKLLLFFLFSGSLDSFSQDDKAGIYLHEIGLKCECSECMDVVKPDTLRAIVLVTLSPNGIAHSRMGFVVISDGKRPVYLDCNKKALKLPMVGWGWELINPNYKK